MNIADAQKAVDEIRSVSGDPEIAHIKEDDLYRAALTAIAEGMSAEHARALAHTVLTTSDIEFPRWHA